LATAGLVPPLRFKKGLRRRPKLEILANYK